MGHKATIECDKVRQSFRVYSHGATLEYVQEQLHTARAVSIHPPLWQH